MPNPAVIKAAAALLSDERARKGIGWIIAAILSPLIVLLALLCSLSASSGHNASVVELCFNGGTLPPDTPAEYAAYIEDRPPLLLGLYVVTVVFLCLKAANFRLAGLQHHIVHIDEVTVTSLWGVDKAVELAAGHLDPLDLVRLTPGVLHPKISLVHAFLRFWHLW